MEIAKKAKHMDLGFLKGLIGLTPRSRVEMGALSASNSDGELFEAKSMDIRKSIGSLCPGGCRNPWKSGNPIIPGVMEAGWLAQGFAKPLRRSPSVSDPRRAYLRAQVPPL